MDREQEEMQFLGLFGIYKEAYKVIFSCRKIFSQITLALIIPLSLIFLAHVEVTYVLLGKIMHNERDLDNSLEGTSDYDAVSDAISSEWTMFWIVKAFYFTFVLIFSLLSTSAVVYTVACVYTAREISFKKVMSVVPKVWKRLMVTFLCVFLVIFLYNIMLILTLFMAVSIGSVPKIVFSIFIIILIIFYLVGFGYMSIIWHLANVVCVLEDVYGVKAMVKGKELIKGKLGVAMIVFFIQNLSLGIIQFGFDRLVVHGDSLGMISRVGYGILCLLLLFQLILFGLVLQTVIYFVCKSYHHQNIDKSTLSDHLEVFLGQYVPLTANDVQLEHFYV